MKIRYIFVVIFFLITIPSIVVQESYGNGYSPYPILDLVALIMAYIIIFTGQYFALILCQLFFVYKSKLFSSSSETISIADIVFMLLFKP